MFRTLFELGKISSVKRKWSKQERHFQRQGREPCQCRYFCLWSGNLGIFFAYLLDCVLLLLDCIIFLKQTHSELYQKNTFSFCFKIKHACSFVSPCLAQQCQTAKKLANFPPKNFVGEVRVGGVGKSIKINLSEILGCLVACVFFHGEGGQKQHCFLWESQQQLRNLALQAQSLCVGEAASAACGMGGSAWQQALALSLSVFLPPQPPLGVTRMNSTQV